MSVRSIGKFLPSLKLRLGTKTVISAFLLIAVNTALVVGAAHWSLTNEFGTRALRAVADWTFATTAAFRLDAYIMVGNDASMRMTERAGFQREGVARAWDLHHDGVPVDCVVYSRLRTDA